MHYFRTFLAFLFLLVPQFFLGGLSLAGMGLSAVVLYPGWDSATATRMFTVLLGTALVLLSVKVYRAGCRYLDEHDFVYVAFFSIFAGLALSVWLSVRLPDSGMVARVFVVAPWIFWGLILLNKWFAMKAAMKDGKREKSERN